MMWHPVPYLICSFHNHHFFCFVCSVNKLCSIANHKVRFKSTIEAGVNQLQFIYWYFNFFFFFFAHSHVHSAAYGHIMFCSEKICVMNKNDHKIWTLDRPQYSSLETPWPFNYSTTHLVRHDLLQGNCNFFCLFFYFVFCSTFATNPTNLSWPSAPLWSYRAFTYKPFPGLIALQYNLHLYSPPTYQHDLAPLSMIKINLLYWPWVAAALLVCVFVCAPSM